MNLFSKRNFLGGDKQNTGGTEKQLLFSGFLILFLGASGVQANISEDVLQKEFTEEKKESVCPKEKESLASLEISEGFSPEKKEEEESEECKKEKEIHASLEEGIELPQEIDGEISIVAKQKQKEKEEYEARVAQFEELLEGYPLAKMAPEIAKQDPEIAALIVGIARKESQWGVRSPKKNGDCFNYWGFKGAGGRGVGMGHACFATREEAVSKIANRLERLVEKRGTSKPSALVTTWKCGSSCATHSPESVTKWVSDVNQYYTKVLAMK